MTFSGLMTLKNINLITGLCTFGDIKNTFETVGVTLMNHSYGESFIHVFLPCKGLNYPSESGAAAGGQTARPNRSTNNTLVFVLTIHLILKDIDFLCG